MRVDAPSSHAAAYTATRSFMVRARCNATLARWRRMLMSWPCSGNSEAPTLAVTQTVVVQAVVDGELLECQAQTEDQADLFPDRREKVAPHRQVAMWATDHERAEMLLARPERHRRHRTTAVCDEHLVQLTVPAHG